MTKLGPWLSKHCCASVSGVFKKFLTQLLLLLLLLLVVLLKELMLLLLCPWSAVSVMVTATASWVVFIHVLVFEWQFSSWSPCRGFERPPLFLWHNLLNLDTCLSKVFWYLPSLLYSIYLIQSSMVFSSNMPSSWIIHVSMIILNMAIELLIALILSFNKANSAFLIIYFPLGVLMFDFNLMLVGIKPLLRYLKEKGLWLRKSAIFTFKFLPSLIDLQTSYMTIITSLVMMSLLTILPYWGERTKTS